MALPGGSRGRAASPGLPAFILAFLLLLLPPTASGCTFERRADAADEQGQEEPDTAPAVRTGILRDSVRAAVDAFVDALRDGDQARAVSLLHEEVTLHDEASGLRWDPSRADSLLPGPLEREGEGEELHWERSDSRIDVYDGAALVVRRYRASASLQEAPRTAMETYVLVRTDGGWRIRHLHRSRAPEPGS